MKVDKFYAYLRIKLWNRNDIRIESFPLKYRHEAYEFLRIISASIAFDDRVVVLSTGFHGDELNDYTMLAHVNEIIDRAHASGLKIIIFPLVNPSGYEYNTRYNVDDEHPNNDFVRYELEDGKMLEELKEETNFKRWHFADQIPGQSLPQETRLMSERLRELPLGQIVAMIDLHRDPQTLPGQSGAYHYAFGDLSRYDSIVGEIRKIVPVLGSIEIGAGQSSGMTTDALGFIVRYDGGITDLMHRLGVPHCVTVETLSDTPKDFADAVNMAWICGVISLLQKEVRSG